MRTRLAVVMLATVAAVAFAAVPALATCPSGSTNTDYCSTGAPVVKTQAASEIANTGAKLNGDVNPNGLQTTYHFEYGTSTTYGTKTTDNTITVSSPAVVADYSSKSFSASITGLQPGTTYHYRIVATNSTGTTNGDDVTFQTSAYGIPTTGQAAPTAVTGAASAITQTTAMVAGTVNPHNSASQYTFRYGTTAAYGSVTMAQVVPGAADSTDHVVSANLTGLLPGTTYHYRIVAGNAQGIGFGDDATFKTGTATTPPSTGKLRPKLSLVASPKRDSKKPYVYRAIGKLKLPTGVSKAAGCKGTITVKIRRGSKLVGSAKTKLKKSCKYSKKVVVTEDLQKIGGRGAKRGNLHVKAYFRGNSKLKTAKSRKVTVIYGSARKRH